MKATISLDANDAKRIAEPLAEALRPTLEEIFKAALAEAGPIGGAAAPPIRMLNKKEVAARFGVGLRTVDRLEEDGHIPRRRQISPGRVGWLEHECDAALLSKPLGLGGKPLPDDRSSESGRRGPRRHIDRGRSERLRSCRSG